MEQKFRQDHPVDHIYQFSVPVGDATAYLWIPPDCSQLRGAIVSLSNMLERNWLEDPVIRRCARKEQLAIVWVGPAKQPKKNHRKTEILPDMDAQSGLLLTKMFNDFATISGYRELENIPLIPMGHSARGQFAWTVAGWNPARVIAGIAVKTVPLPQHLNFKGIPLCYIVGQTTEWPQYKDGRKGDRDFFWPIVRHSAVHLRSQNEQNLIGVVTEAGGGHFDWSEHQAVFMALYIHKACASRLPAPPRKYKQKCESADTAAPVLRPVKATSGWLTDTGGMEPDHFSCDAYVRYKGPKNKAYWFFDEELAKAAVAFEGIRKIRKKQMVSFLQNGKVMEVSKKGFASLDYRQLDKALEKDENSGSFSFRLQAGYLATIPAELIGSGNSLGHGGGKVCFRKITGPVLQTGKNTFRRELDRGGSGPVWIEVYKKGDRNYRRAVQPAQIAIPSNLSKGPPQHISFPGIQNISERTTYVSLHARSDAGLPVHYFVDAGPAIVDENHRGLKIMDIPVKSRFPVKITVTAYQWGREEPPFCQTATPVTRSFYIERPAGEKISSSSIGKS